MLHNTAPRLRRRALTAMVAATLMSGGLAGCSLFNRGDSPTTTATTASGTFTPQGRLGALGDTSNNPKYASFYKQRVTWKRCGDLTCGTVKVPLDWTTPDSGSVSIAINRRKATGANPLGAILYNPGGPGGSGVDIVREVSTISDRVAKRYDLVGFDPRGVGHSSPVDCVSDKELDAYLGADSDPETAAGMKEQQAADKRFGEGCVQKTGPLINHVDTWSAARDMDVIRAALGEQRLNYLGQSYGTLLGTEYAGFYPKRVGRFVLDGALIPNLTSTQFSVAQAAGFEVALRSYMKACLSGSTGECPFTGTVDDALKQAHALLQKVDDHPIPVGRRTLTGNLASTGVVAPLYDETQWYGLSQAFNQLKRGDGHTMLYLADEYNSRKDNGSYESNGNGTESFYAITCLDYPPQAKTPDELKAQTAQIEKAAPTLGKWFGYSDLFCDSYPVKAVRTPHRVTAAGAAPIVVVGTLRDPATPYRWAKTLAGQLSSATLLTYDGDGHTAYQRESDCIDNSVDSYFIDGTVPAKGTICR